jgi:hypothetical protein
MACGDGGLEWLEFGRLTLTCQWPLTCQWSLVGVAEVTRESAVPRVASAVA